MRKLTIGVIDKSLPLNPAYDLTGKRFGKWVVLGYVGRRVYQSTGYEHSMQMWLCRCDCGVQNNVCRSNLTRNVSTQCLRCARTKHNIPRTKLYLTWQRMMKRGTLPNEWKDYEVFSKDVGEAPDNAAKLRKYVTSKPHGPDNSFWAIPSAKYLARQMQRRLKEKSILQRKVLVKIRTAKTKFEKKRYMIAARKAGYTYEMIGVAAGVSRQSVHQLIAKSMKSDSP